MKEKVAKINRLLVDVYDDIGKIEESSLRKGAFTDLSITELHTIEAVGLYQAKTMSEAAANLEITTGTLTAAVDRLVRKGYMERSRGEADRRVVNIYLTKKGKLAYRMHEKFHLDMVRGVVEDLSEEELEVLVRGLEKLNAYLRQIYRNEE